MLTRSILDASAHRLLLLSAVLPAIIAYNLPYTTIAEKNVAGYKLTDASSFSIPDNQCSGFIDESLLCGAAGVAGAVRVEVRESTSFATVRIHRRLRNATVLRARDVWGVCAGAAEVDVFVGCLVASPRSPRTRRSVDVLPPASTHTLDD
ncbi:unnamed protein product [Euphydryas editha]|uniref:Uncharacterized protein n=1 Tax=Euphydryas editha TaxID=104508 RepID=A0AAU9V1F6_EUPED|nr:unnamed protein product [Euphydryas editha]